MRPRGVTPEPERSELLAAAERAKGVRTRLHPEEIDLRAAVRNAKSAGGSIRDIAGLAECSTNTVQRWLKEG